MCIYFFIPGRSSITMYHGSLIEEKHVTRTFVNNFVRNSRYIRIATNIILIADVSQREPVKDEFPKKQFILLPAACTCCAAPGQHRLGWQAGLTPAIRVHKDQNMAEIQFFFG